MIMDEHSLRQKADALTWYHTIDLGHNVITKGAVNTIRRLPRYKLPENLSGLRVLDIGANNGFFSIEASKRGAKVVAMDRWSGDGAAPREQFDLACRATGTSVETHDLDVYDLAPDKFGVFDMVFFLGVLYHLKHPILALEKVASVTKGTMILETHADALGLDYPSAVYYTGSQINYDPTNYWGPNPLAVEAWVMEAGFASFKPISLYYLQKGEKSGEWALAENGQSMSELVRSVQSGRGEIERARVVYHAYKFE
jgi:tRNA (mo5U34)-methyltransferase